MKTTSPNPILRFAVSLPVAALLFLMSAGAAHALTFSVPTIFTGANGAQPAASMILWTNDGDFNGYFYGTTVRGGGDGLGTVFRASPNGTVTSLVSLDSTIGSLPYASLMTGRDGNLYGTASAGGYYSNGTVFVVSPDLSFVDSLSLDSDIGAQPFGSLTQDTNGVLYGTAFSGGSNGFGTVFSVTITNGGGLSNAVLTSVASFNVVNGAQPRGGPVYVKGALYGTTTAGGAHNAGTIFKLSWNRNSVISTNISVISTNISVISTNDSVITTNISVISTNISVITTNISMTPSLTNVYSFLGATDGLNPQAGMILGYDGNLYGSTVGGGTNRQGTLFRFSPSGNSLTTLHTFGGPDGAQPVASLVQTTQGATNFFGTTRAGGKYGQGTVFRLGSNGSFTNIYSFYEHDDVHPGATPLAGLVQGADENLYGLTSAGGRFNKGTLYQLGHFIPPYFKIAGDGNTYNYAAGSTVTLSVQAGGSPPLYYFWFINTNKFSDSARVFGSSTPNLTISNITAAYAGTYKVVVVNSVGMVTNTSAVVRVVNQAVVRVTSPAQGAVLLKTNATVTGTATDNLPVGQVTWQINGGGWQPATTLNGFAQWTANPMLVPGTNLFEVYALDLLNRPSVTNSLVLIYSVGKTPVTVRVSGPGTVVPVHDGQPLYVSRTYTVLAKAAPGSVVSNLTISSPSDILAFTDFPTASFVMESNVVIQATFTQSPFTPLSGGYYGLFFETNRVAQESSGFLALALVPGGTFSGYLQFGTSRYPMSGRFHLDGSAEVTVKRGKQNSVTVTLQLDLSGATQQITGTVTDNENWLAALTANRAMFDGRTLVAPQAGQYTLVLPGTTNPSCGDGYAIASISRAGVARLAGVLADGTRISEAALISTNGDWPVYVPLYSGLGSIISWLSVSNAPDQDLGGTLNWVRPAFPKAKYYKDGFSFQTTAIGSRYQKPGVGTNVLGLASAQLTLSDGNLVSNLVNQLVLGTGNQVNSQNVALKLTPANGYFQGGIVPPGATRATAFSGVVLQNQQVGRGFFLGTNQSGTVFLGPVRD